MTSIILKSNCNPNTIYLNSQTLKQLDIHSQHINLHFGKLTRKLRVVINNSLRQGSIILPQNLSATIRIPDLPYDHYFRRENLFLGPVIGCLVFPAFLMNPGGLALRFINYNKIRGLIFLFRPENINAKNNTISGKYYNPRTKKFVKGIFPYPSAIFNRIPLSKQTYSHLKSKVGAKVFNYPFFSSNKWLFWQRMSKQPLISKHLPETTEYTGISSLLSALNKHPAIYIKPTNLSRGRGILHVLKSGSKYILSDTLGNKRTCETPKKLSLVLKNKLLQNKQYILQQPISFVTNSGNKLDFRVYIQKDRSGNWRYSGMETKVAKKGSIISNFANRARIVPGEKALETFFGLDQISVQQKIKQITQLGIKVLKVMEQHSGHLGDAAIDMVLDKNHKIWLLEVQLNYAAEKKASRSIDERRVLPAILPTPLEYAKTLAGF